MTLDGGPTRCEAVTAQRHIRFVSITCAPHAWPSRACCSEGAAHTHRRGVVSEFSPHPQKCTANENCPQSSAIVFNPTEAPGAESVRLFLTLLRARCTHGEMTRALCAQRGAGRGGERALGVCAACAWGTSLRYMSCALAAWQQNKKYKTKDRHIIYATRNTQHSHVHMQQGNNGNMYTNCVRSYEK